MYLHEVHYNKMTFHFEGHKYTLCTLTLEEVREDDIN